jgi:hypothetical protein
MRHSPVVYVQAWIEIQNERAIVVSPEHGQVITSRFVVPERASPINVEVVGSSSNEVAGKDTVGGLVSSIVHMREDGDDEDPLSANATLAVAYSPFTGLHWSGYSLFILCGFIFLLGLVGMGAYQGMKRAKRKMRHLDPFSYTEKKDAQNSKLISDWIGMAVRRGLYGERKNHT